MLGFHVYPPKLYPPKTRMHQRKNRHAKPGDGMPAEVTSFTFAEACAQPSAKRLEYHGSDGPVNVVEVDGTFFIQNNEAEAKAARSKALELASEAATNPAAAEEVAANPAAMPEPAVAHRVSYAAAAAKSVGPKPSAAGFGPRPVAAPKFSAGIKRSTPASQPAVVPAPLEVVDDFAVAQSTPLPECIAGVEGDKEGEFYARHEKLNITVLIPKIFQNQSFEAKEVAEELAKKIKAEEDAKAMAKKSAASKRATVAPTKKKTHQKPTKDTKTTEKTTAPAPAEEDAPAKRCSKGFRALVLFGIVALITAFYQSITPPLSALTIPTGPTSHASGPAEVTTKTVTSWSNAFDAPNKDQCGLFDVGPPTYDQRGSLDAPDDSQCAPNEPVVATPEALEQTDPAVGAPDDAAKGFVRSALLDAAATERDGDGLRKKKEGVAVPPQHFKTEEGCPSQWLPLVFGFAPAQVDHEVDAEDVHQPPPADDDGLHAAPSPVPPLSVLAKAEREPRPLSVPNASDLYSDRVLHALALNPRVDVDPGNVSHEGPHTRAAHRELSWCGWWFSWSCPPFKVLTAYTTHKWMARLDPNMLVRDMWIPGTHETMTLGMNNEHWNYPLVDVWARCQEQLDAGIRAIDVRVQYDLYSRGGPCGLGITHGGYEVIRQRDDYDGRSRAYSTWDDVVATLESWIQKHPTEFVLVFAQHEHAPGGMPSRRMESYDICKGRQLYEEMRTRINAGLWNWMRPTPVSWNPDGVELKWTFPAETKYNDVKGKLVFMGRSKLIFNAIEQNEWDAPVGTIREFNGDTAPDQSQTKWGLVWSHAQKVAPADHLSINYLSGSTAWATPRIYADYINPRAYQHAQDARWRPGIVLMDFPSQELIERVMSRNPFNPFW